MEKKQITNSSTVSRAVKDPRLGSGLAASPCLGSCHTQPFSPVLPQKGNKVCNHPMAQSPLLSRITS